MAKQQHTTHSKKDQATIHNCFKKGPGYALILLKYKSPQKRTKPKDVLLKKKDQATT